MKDNEYSILETNRSKYLIMHTVARHIFKNMTVIFDVRKSVMNMTNEYDAP